jgi:DNA-directed RNA polymerase subunit M/transcription elongation factor TFIIS
MIERFACLLCGAADALQWPIDGATEMVCSACGVAQPLRVYELERLKRQFARANERARQERVAAAEPEPDPAVCPSCGDDLFTLAHGCPKCGHGRPSWMARHGYALPFMVFFASMLIGGGLLLSVGAVASTGVVMNVVPMLTGGFLVAFGVRAIRDPTTLRFSQVTHDAWGESHFVGPSRAASHEQGTTAGAICLVLGVLLLGLGVFVGVLI